MGIQQRLGLIIVRQIFVFSLVTKSVRPQLIDRPTPQRCYVCANLDSSQLIDNIQDVSWRSWLRNLSAAPRTDECSRDFIPEMALRSGARTEPCENGVCLKMSLRESGQNGQFVWRSCINGSAQIVRADCTTISTKKGEMEICTCFGTLCNHSISSRLSVLLLVSIILIFGKI